MKRVSYLVSFLFGVIAIGYFSFWQGILFSFFLVLFLLIKKVKWKQAVCLILSFIIGSGYFLINQTLINRSIKQFAETDQAQLQVVSKPEMTSGGNTYFIARIKGKPFKISIYIKGEYSGINYLDTVKIKDFTYYYGSESSYGEYLQSNNVFGNITVEPEQISEVKPVSQFHPQKLLFDLKEGLLHTLNQHFKDENYQLIAGILLGDKSQQTDEFRDMMSVAGISHVIVVSGLHFGILIMLISGMLLRFGLSLRKRSVICILCTLFLAVFMGFTPSIVRVSIMLIIVFICDILLLNQEDKIAVIALTGFLSVLANPNIILSISFILSFSAVLGILLYNEKISGFLQKIKITYKPINSIISASVAAQIIAFPFLIYYFQQFSLVFVLGNLLVCLLLSLLMGYGIIFLVAASLFPAVGWVLSIPLNLLLNIILFGLDQICRIPFASVSVYAEDKIWIILYFLSLYLFYKLTKYRLIAGITCVCLLTASLFISIPNILLDGVDLFCLNISDNTAYLFRTKKNQTIFLDLASGRERTEYDLKAVKKAVVNYVGGKVDCYIAGGKEQLSTLKQVSNEINVDSIYLPEVLREEANALSVPAEFFKSDIILGMEEIRLHLLVQDKDGLVTTAVTDYNENHLLMSSKMNEKRYDAVKSEDYDIVIVNRYISSVYKKLYGSVEEFNGEKIIYNLTDKTEFEHCFNIGFYDKIKIKLLPSKNIVIK